MFKGQVALLPNGFSLKEDRDRWQPSVSTWLETAQRAEERLRLRGEVREEWGRRRFEVWHPGTRIRTHTLRQPPSEGQVTGQVLSRHAVLGGGEEGGAPRWAMNLCVIWAGKCTAPRCYITTGKGHHSMWRRFSGCPARRKATPTQFNVPCRWCVPVRAHRS